jgi:excisionase family DNA binding protein
MHGLDQNKELTTTHVANLLGLSVTSIQKMIDDGKIKAWKTKGGHRRIHVRDIVKFLKHDPTFRPINALRHYIPAIYILCKDCELLGHLKEQLIQKPLLLHVFLFQEPAELLSKMRESTPSYLVIEQHDAPHEIEQLLRGIDKIAESGPQKIVAFVFNEQANQYADLHFKNLNFRTVPQPLNFDLLHAMLVISASFTH